MLIDSGMGGMDEMGMFYDDCLEQLYPPGSCGTFCNEHTYDCYLTEVNQACCDEEGTNCHEGSDVPTVCPVGCAIVFPEFLETCRDHITEHEATDSAIIVAEFEAFEQQCLTSDGLALVEYALELAARGCIVDLSGTGNHHRRLQQFLMQRLGSTTDQCPWDTLNDKATDTTSICCADNSCPEGSLVPTSCSPGCAVALHEFTVSCGPTLEIIDQDYLQIMQFEQTCLDVADPLFFLNAIRNAQCPNDEYEAVVSPEPEPEPERLPCCTSTTCSVPIAIAMLLCSVLSSHVSLGAAYERLTPCLRACDAVVGCDQSNEQPVRLAQSRLPSQCCFALCSAHTSRLVRRMND